MDSGKVALKLEPVRVGTLANEVRDSLGVLASEKQQTIEFICDDGTIATADRLLLRKALVNIIHNAIRYSALQTRVTIRTLRRDGGACIEVTDQGPGIAPEHRQKIFERFYRVDKSRARSEGGHGLGLAIARWSVEHQAGRIELESEFGKGSVFRIVLPSG